MRELLAVLALAGAVSAQNGAYAQCGGKDFTGSTSCISGYHCVYVNDWYSQCQPGAATTSTRTSTTSPQPTADGEFEFIGVNEAGAEFGQGTYPGTWGTEFIFPDTSTIATLRSQGYNTFRVAFSMERLAPNSVGGSFDAAYLANLTASIQSITSGGSYAVLDPHNFGRYRGSIITDTAAFQTFWKNLATPFKSNSKVVFDTNNEYHDMDQTLVFNLNQVAINGIRAAGATSQWIFVEGNSYSGAWTWVATNDNLKALTDPSNKIVYEMHQYLDSDGSGTSATCVSGTIGVERVQSATAWLRQNGKVGIIGEVAGGANSVCKQAVTGVLDHLQDNSDVWLGFLWWAAGPWWGDYIFNFEPPTGTGYTYYNTLLKSYT